MRRFHFLVSFASLSCGLVAAGACEDGRSSIDLAIRVPQGLLDEVTSMELIVSEGAHCDAATGRVTDEPDAAQRFPMDRSCASGAKWCKDISLEKDGVSRVFHVVGKTATEVAAEGCSEALVDQDPLRVDVALRRYIVPGCCNNGVVDGREQCDPGIQAATDCAGKPVPNVNSGCFGTVPDAVCECDCLAREILLSTPNQGNPAANNDAGTKAELGLAFSHGGTDVLGSNALRAAYADTDSTTVTGSDITMRALDSRLFPIADAAMFINPTLSKQLRLPLSCSNPSVGGIARSQRQPAIAALGGGVAAVVYGSSEKTGTRFDVMMSAQGPSGCAEYAADRLNATTEESCEFPDVAGGPSGAALTLWTQAGAMRGRIWKSAAVLVPTTADLALGIAVTGARPHVAGTSTGWVVVYAGSGDGDNDGVYMMTVAADGMVGVPGLVNTAVMGTQDQPDVASLPDDRLVVTWRSAGSIFFQRFDEKLMAVSGDQEAPLTIDSPVPASVPVVAASGKAFAAAWLAGDGTVWGRFFGADGGFMSNSVTGQNLDFRATHPAIAHLRAGPAIAMGGDGFVAIGWQDTSNDSDHHGMIVRRFPLPQ